MSGPYARVAVVGSGVAGLTAAHVLASSCEVTLYEADHRLGGHADTHEVDGIAVDTGFIVHNERTYPTLLRLFEELGVATQDSDMSLSVRCDATGVEYAGALGLPGLFPGPRSLRPSHLRMLLEIPRFHRMAARTLTAHAEGDRTREDETLGEFLVRGRFSDTFRTHFMEALVAAVWSCDPAVATDYPARYLFTFLQHHGMLQIFGSPQWRTVTGGSREYVVRLAASLTRRGAVIRTGTKVTSVAESLAGVQITDGNGQVDRFDAVVLAAHPTQCLAMLAEPTVAQRELLGAMPYSANTAQLHTDTSVLPRQQRARASWNYLRRPAAPDRGVTVTYDLTRLMQLPSPDGRRLLVTLGGVDLVDPAQVLGTMEYEHPIYTPTSVAAQQRLAECDTDRITFAGAWHGWGFHEDGARSGVEAAARLGVEWQPSVATAPTRTPAMYASTIRHLRRGPIKRSFTHHQHTWLVDLDELPDHGLLGRFEARDHLGDPDLSIRANVENFLSTQGIELDGGRILMAAHARAFGHCFNPISVHWCHHRDGSLAGVVVEVHNTYGERHAYLVHPDAQGRARTDKQLYVSPFFGTDGHYELAVPTPGERLFVSVTLRTDAGEVFTASLDGHRTDVRPWRAAPAALGGSLLIRAHGIWLWARRLRVHPRPPYPRQEGV